MKKCEAGAYIPYFEKTVCDGCIHKDVCGNADYLTKNTCPDKLDKTQKDGWASAKDRAPCRVGDTVWTNLVVSGDYLRIKDKPYACTVIFIGLNQSESGGYINVEYQKSGHQFPFDFSDFGRLAFLTREAAEAALKGEQRGNE